MPHQHYVITYVSGAYVSQATASTLAAAERAARQLEADAFSVRPDSRSSVYTLSIVGPVAGPAA